MGIFNNYPIIGYDNLATRDISIRVALREQIKENRDLFFYYEVQDRETPEDVAFNHYGDANTHWIILFMNDIIDPFYDWVMSRQELTKFCEAKYGKPSILNGEYQSDGYNAIHHWEYNGIYYYEAPDSGTGRDAPMDSIPYTLFEYEDRLNEAKREIKVLYPEFVGKMKRELQYLIDNGY